MENTNETKPTIDRFTPGPWVVAYDRRVHPEADPWVTVAQQYGGRDGVVLGKEEQSANAHLIAAAPQMLAALRGVISAWGGHMRDDGCGCADCEYLRPVVDAIAAASESQREAAGTADEKPDGQAENDKIQP